MVGSVGQPLGDDGAGLAPAQLRREAGAAFGPVQQVGAGGEAEAGDPRVVGGVGEVEGAVDADEARVLAAAGGFVGFGGGEDGAGEAGEGGARRGPGEADGGG